MSAADHLEQDLTEFLDTVGYRSSRVSTYALYGLRVIVLGLALALILVVG